MNKQLEAVAQEFSTWRKNREKRTYKPSSLINKAVSLRGQVSDADIIKHLGINRTAFMKWAQQDNMHETSAQFVELPSIPITTDDDSSSDTATQQNSSTLNMTLPSGVSLSLSGGSRTLADFVLQLTQQGAL